MPWWLDQEDPPGRIRGLWIRNTRFLYRGPKAWVVWLSLAISGSTLVPYLEWLLVWLFSKHSIFHGDSDTLFGGFALLLLGATSEIPYGACALIVLSACCVLIVQEIPLKVRQVTAAIQIMALGQFLWTLHHLKGVFQYGLFGKP